MLLKWRFWIFEKKRSTNVYTYYYYYNYYSTLEKYSGKEIIKEKKQKASPCLGICFHFSTNTGKT